MRASDAPYSEIDLLRFSTAGSVDDGKSTLIGRLLHDTKSIFEDQLEAVQRTSRQRGDGYVNLALLTDGLRAEREQNITIDVAYRYFATPKRRFIIADTPGHLQYTRNMVTGASTAELAIVLVDARKGVLTQSRRHGFIAALLEIPHVVVAVNKMDLVHYSEAVYRQIVAVYTRFAERLDVRNLVFVPISALLGDNVVDASDNMPWYDGGTLLHHLETVSVGATRNLRDFRFPVQSIIRPNQDYRGVAGRIASGTIRAGEAVIVLPGGHGTRVRSIDTADGPLDEAAAGDSVVIRLGDEIDVSRGDMLVRPHNQPAIANRLDAMVCWTSERPLDPTVPYMLMHSTREVQAYVPELLYRVDVDTLHREHVPTLRLNDIGRVQLLTARPIFCDPYARNRTLGSFILVDPHTHDTVAAGMIRGELRDAPRPEPGAARAGRGGVSPNVVWAPWNIGRAEREARQGHPAAVLWLTGVPAAGKSTIGQALERRLFDLGCRTMLLDGDQVRHGLCGDLGFSDADRTENVRRVGEVARLFFEAGHVVLCTFVSPYRADRDRVRALLPAGRFVEIHVHADLATARRRDPKGLYAQAERGELAQLTGVSSPYEVPERPELTIDTTVCDVDGSVETILTWLGEAALLRVDPTGPAATGDGGASAPRT